MLEANFVMEDQPDGSCVVRDVPIFAECEKDGFKFDAGWIDEAVKYHRDLEANKGVSPVHIGHHGEPVEVKPAGAWTNTRGKPIRAKDGSIRRGVVVDLVFTNREAAERAKRNELLWRSPEIPLSSASRKAPPRFRSLALLDRNAPHNDDLTVLTVKPVSFENTKWCALEGSGPVLAFQAREDVVLALMEPESTVSETPAKTPEKMRLRFSASSGVLTNLDTNETVTVSSGADLGSIHFEADVAAGPAALLERVKALTAEDLAEFHKQYAVFRAEIGADGAAAITNPLGGVGSQNMSENVEKPAAPAADVVKLAAEVETLKAERDARVRADTLKAKVAEGLKSCAGRALPKDAEARFLAFGEKYGPDAVLALAEQWSAALPLATASFVETIDGGARHDQTVPDAVLKFQANGPAAYEGAIASWKRYEQVKAAGHTGLSLERWLEVQGAAGFARGSVKQEV